MKILSFNFILVLSLFLYDEPHSASESHLKRTSSEDTAIIVEQVSRVLNEYYVYPEVAKAMESFINIQMSNGAYQNAFTQQKLIEELQSDLREISSDGHISLHLANHSKDRRSQVLPRTELQKQVHADFISSGKATNKIGYLRFDKFSGDPQTKKLITEAMISLAASNSLIIDMRENIGGDPNLVAFLSSYFVEDNTPLWSLIDRDGNEVLKVKSKVNNNKFNGKLYLLTSNKTYSAAEAFVYTLKHLGRAYIIGEPTGGGAHLVEMQRVTDDIDIRIPVLRAYNSVTESNWERNGVIPMIAVEASKAKSAAIKHIEKFTDETRID